MVAGREQSGRRRPQQASRLAALAADLQTGERAPEGLERPGVTSFPLAAVETQEDHHRRRRQVTPVAQLQDLAVPGVKPRDRLEDQRPMGLALQSAEDLAFHVDVGRETRACGVVETDVRRPRSSAATRSPASLAQQIARLVQRNGPQPSRRVGGAGELRPLGCRCRQRGQRSHVGALQHVFDLVRGEGAVQPSP